MVHRDLKPENVLYVDVARRAEVNESPYRHGFHKVMRAVDEVVDDKIAYFARSCNYTYNLGY